LDLIEKLTVLIPPPRFHLLRFHGLRHSFASRLVMAGVDLRTVQELGGWRTLMMVMRYAHLSPTHLHAAVERIAAVPGGSRGGVKVGLNLDSAGGAAQAAIEKRQLSM
jgi:Phage integrase family